MTIELLTNDLAEYELPTQPQMDHIPPHYIDTIKTDLGDRDEHPLGRNMLRDYIRIDTVRYN